MTRDEKSKILDMIAEVIERCEESIYRPESESYQSLVNPEKVRKVIRDMKESFYIGGPP